MTLLYDGDVPAAGSSVGGTIRVRDSVEEKRKGLAHFAEHLLSRQLRVRTVPAVLSVHPRPEDWSARTTMEAISVQWSGCPTAQLWEAADAFLNILRQPQAALTIQAFEAVRRAIIAEMEPVARALAGWSDQPGYGQAPVEPGGRIAWTELSSASLRLMFPGTALGVGDPGGMSADMKTVTLEQIKTYVDCHVVPAACLVLVIAKRSVDEQRLDAAVLNRLEHAPGGG